MSKYTEIDITLRLTLDNGVAPTHFPEEWDFHNLLDLGKNERVEVTSTKTNKGLRV